MKTSKLNIIELSDVHLGHKTTSTAHIVNNLATLLPDDPSMGSVDLMIIAGDLFDRLLNLASPDVYIIHKWIYYILNLCVKHDIVLRVLEGTPSHDNKQNRLLLEVNEQSSLGCDIKYFDTLDIEYIDRFGISILYIPDEWHPDCSQTLAEVRLLLKNKGYEQVDFAVMHGQFDYQVPSNLLTRIAHHDSSAYLQLVKYLIFIGHVHQHSQFDRIISAGSTDRLRHGEEEDKGIVKVEVFSNGVFNATFVVNKNAKVYKTLDVSNMSITQAMNFIDNTITQYPDDSYIRVKSNQEDSIVNTLKELKTNYPQFNWSMLSSKAVATSNQLIAKPRVVMDNLHRGTLPKLLSKRMEGRYDKTTIDSTVAMMQSILETCDD